MPGPGISGCDAVLRDALNTAQGVFRRSPPLPAVCICGRPYAVFRDAGPCEAGPRDVGQRAAETCDVASTSPAPAWQ